MRYVCLNCGYEREKYPPLKCPVCRGTTEYFRSKEYLHKKADQRIKEEIDKPSEKTKENFLKSNYRASSGQDSCANCAHMEVLDVGTYRERCRCRPMDFMFTNNEQNKAHVCDMFEDSSKTDGLMSELVMAITQNNGQKT